MKKIRIFAGLIALLLLARLALPYTVVYYVNKHLAGMEGYHGHIDSVTLSIYRGAYGLSGMSLDKIDPSSGERTHFFSARHIELSVEWKALLHGAIVGKVAVSAPDLIFKRDKVDLKDVAQATTDYRKFFKNLMPLKVNRLDISQGSVHYVDNTTTPPLDVFLKELELTAYNLSNAYADKGKLPSTLNARASVYGGTLNLNMRLNALAEKPAFTLQVQMTKTNLVLLNDFLKAYGKFDVSRGTFAMYIEMEAKDGKFEGYVKPFITDLQVTGLKDRNKTLLHKLWESIVGGAAAVLKNRKENQLATKVPLSGNFDNPKIGILQAVWEVLRNGFIQALVPGIDNDVDLNSLHPGMKKQK